MSGGSVSGGSVRVVVGSGTTMDVPAGGSRSVVATAGATATLTATARAGYRFAGWTSPDGPACVGGLAGNPCELAAGSVTDDATVSAAFEAVPSTLTVAAGDGGWVVAELTGVAAATVNADASQRLAFSVLSAATLTATASAGWAFAGWTSPDGPACTDGPAGNPCALAAGSVTDDATVSAAFEAVPSTLTVAAGDGGWVVAELTGVAAATVNADASQRLAFSVLSAATLTATASAGWAFAGWTSPGGPACAGGPAGNPCELAAGSATADATVSAAFEAVPSTLTVVAGAGGWVVAELTGIAAVTVNADSSQRLAFSVLSAATLTATASAGWAFAGWTLSGGLSACVGGPAGNPCELAAGSATADATVSAAFEAVPSTLTVAAGTNGWVVAELTGIAAVTVNADASQRLAFSVLSAATLTATASAGWAFAGWTLSGGLSACVGGPAGNPCELAAGSATADATVSAAFEAVPSTLTVAAGAGGWVVAELTGVAAATVNADASQRLAFSVLSAATLTATASAGWAFAGWTLSGGLSACVGGPAGNPCELAAGSVTADAMVSATFEAVPSTLTVAAGAGGWVVAELTGVAAATVNADASQRLAFSALSAATLTATASAGWAFAGWTSPDGPACVGGPAGNPCALAAGSATADAMVSATFEAVPSTLTVAAGAGGWVAAELTGVAAATVNADASQGLAFSVLSAATLTATASAGWAFAGWTSPDGPACVGGPAGNPCALAAGSATADATVSAAFEAVPSTLTVAAGTNGSVVAELTGVAAATVNADASQGLAFSVLSAATLTATASAGYRFAGWTSPDGPACAGGPAGNPCALAAGSATDDATVSAAFELVPSTLTVAAGTNGSVVAERTGVAAATVNADSSQGLAFSVLSAATLTATARAGYRFAGWTSPDGPACAGGLAGNPCELAAGSVTADATVSAAFELVPSTLTVAAGAGGWVAAELTGVAAATVNADSSQGLAFSVLSAATLTATASAGWAFAGWTSPDGPACAGGPAGNPCALAAGSATADATVSAAFEAVPSTLTVAAGTNGSVVAERTGVAAATVNADSSQRLAFSVLSAATLTATASAGYRFAGWTSPDGPACAGGLAGNPCELAAGSVTADATVSATFELRPPATWRGPGSVSVSSDGSTHTAAAYAPGAFENWDGAPCDGSTQTACGVSSVMASASLPAAVFRPFVVGGIKSLTFGLGYHYHGDAPHYFSVSLLDAPGAGLTPLPSLERLVPDSGPARLAVSVHLLPWGLGAYLTEACDASNSCATASGGQRTLKQADSVAAAGYFKAPNAGGNDNFGYILALSEDGSTLAVGAPREDSASTGTFAPGGTGYQAALGNGGARDSGAVTVYRRSVTDGLWALEAFVKAPRADSGDNFGWALALSADGATLAVGAYREDSASTGTFAPSDVGYQTALDRDNAFRSGAVYVYRRSVTDSLWAIEAFIKAPRADGDDNFGAALALSDSGSALAVGAPFDDSASAGVFTPGGTGYQTALDSSRASDSGAVTVYRRSGSVWGIEAFVKAPRADAGDRFGDALALSDNGTTLAVGARYEDSASAGVFVPGGTGYQIALGNGGIPNSGAVSVYRHSGSAWSFEAFVKAPKANANDNFGWALALSADGATLAVSTRYEDSASAGVFVPGGPGYQAALENNIVLNSGAAYIYRHSDSEWTLEVFVKAPKAGSNDNFGWTLALSDDGATLAVGAPGEDSASAGVFAPGGTGYQTALDGSGSGNSGGVAVYRYSDSAWSIKVFVKAPKTGVGDQFGFSLSLSGDAATLAVGAYNEDGGSLPQPVGGESSDTRNAVANAGAAYLY